MRALNERLKQEQKSLPEKEEENWPSIDDENATKETERDKENERTLENSEDVAETVDKREVET